MANDLKLTFSTGALSNLPSTFKAGQVLFAIDENNKGYIYFDKNSSTRILMGSDAAYAEKANKDSNGNVIVSTYLTNLQGVKNAAETEYIIQGVRGDGSAPFDTSAVIPITLLSSENKTGTKLYLVGTTSQSSKGIVGYSNSNIYITTGNKLHANLEGKADTAGTADIANAIEWSKITSKPQLVEGFDGSLENNGYKIQLYNTSGSPIPAANTALNGTITIPFAAADSIGLMSTGDQHFSGVKRFDDGINVEDLVPIESHTYIDVIGTANSSAGAGFFYAKVRGKTYNGVWHVKVRVKATVPSNANYETLSYFDLWGTANTYIAYKCQNAIKNTSYRPIYYHSYYRINQNGYNADLGGWLGFNLSSSANPTNASFKRTVTVDLLMYENCDIEFVSTLLKSADIPNVTVTGNYNSSTTSYDNFDCCNNGLRETGDDNDTSTMISPYNRFTAGEGGLKRYSLAMRDTTGRWQSFTTGTGGNSSTPKSKNTAKFIMGDIVYLSMGSDVASGNIIGTSVVRHYQSLIDYRYSTNAGSATLTANKTVYIVGTVDEDGLFSLDDTWWSQDLPTTEDGKVYIPLGVVYSDSSTYRCDFSGWHTPLIYRNGKIVSYTDTVDISHTTGTLSVPRGGTGQVSFTAGELLMGNGTDAISSVAKASDNTANTVVYRDANGNFSAGIITANLTGTATKALQDNKGQQIDTTYYKDFTVSGTTITLTRGDGDTSKTLNIAALPLTGGIMTGAIKRYYGTASTDPMISMSSNDKDAILFQVGHNTSATPAATNYYKLMYKGSGTSPNNLLQLIAAKNTSNEVIAIKVDENGNVTFTNTVTANISGSATSATKDSANQQITTTYIKDVSVSGTTLTITKGSGSTSTITLQDFDVKVNMKARGTTKAYLLGTVTAPTSTDQAITSVAETGVYFDTTAAKLVATTFKGALEGNADTATKATKDSANQQINTTYIKDLSISGTTITVTKGDGSTSTLTTQDNNTDTKVNVTLGTTTKAYLLGTSTTPTATAQGVTAIADTGIYLDTTAGQLVATTFKGDLDGNAATATKALKDDKGQQIDVTYYKDFSVSGTTITFTRGDGDTNKTLTIAALPLAGGTMTGAIKRYYGSASTDPMISLAANNQDAILFQVGHGGNSNVSTQNYYKLLYKGTSNQPNNYLQLITANTTNSEVVAIQINEQGNVSFTNTVTANISGSAVSATKDSSGQQINTTYIKNISINGTTLTFTKGNGDDTDLTLQDFDVKVNMIARGTTKAYLLGTTTSPTSTNQAVTSVAETGVYFDTTAAKLVATTFKGALEGNADTATKALQDNKGQQIDTTYIKNITIDDTNHKLTFTNGFGGDTNLSLNFVKLTGDTMSGDLVSSSSDTAARGIRVQNSNGSVGVYTATNRGLKDFTKNDWIIYRSTAGTTTYVTNNNYTWTYTSDGKFDAPGDLGESANLIGTASRAVGDQFGHSIVDYVRNISISGQTITVTTGSGAETTLTTQDTNTDTKVNVTLNTTAKAYLLATTTTPTSTAQAVTSIADTGVYLDTAAGALTATTFKGNLAWSYLTSIPQIVEGALGTWETTGYQIQLYNLAGGAITSSTVATNGVITIPFAADNAAGLISTGEQTLSGIKHIDASGSSISASKYYQFTTTVGKTHIGWIKFAQLNLNDSNHFGAHQFDIFISRSYNSPSPEVYALRVSVSWNRCQIIQLGGDWNGHIITHFRVVKDNTNHKVYFEYYVSENSTGNNIGYIRIIQRFGTYTLIPLNEVQTEQDTDFADKWSIELSRDGIVANLIGNASTATYAEKAAKDESGNNIKTYYAHELSGAHTASNKNEYILTLANTNGTALSTVTLPLASNTQAGLMSIAAQQIAGTKTFMNGLEVYGTIPGDTSTTTGHGLQSAGGYHNAHNSIILHGDTSGVSGIAFTSSKQNTNGEIVNINAPSDRAFIQFHAHGITTPTAESVAPTLATSGEANRLVIGVGNDSNDEVWLQTPSDQGLKHQVGTNTYTIVTAGNYTKIIPYVNNLESWTNGTTAGPIPVFKTIVGGTWNGAAVPIASTTVSGVVTTSDQTFAGNKTFISVTKLGRNVFRNQTDAPLQGEAILTALGFKTGYPVYTDPTFKTGLNSVSVYNNNGQNAPYVSVTRMLYSEAGLAQKPGTDSDYVVRIQNTGTGTTPGLGGFVQTISARANAVFVQIFRALVPIGYNLVTATNTMGTNYKDEWITSNTGTGKWEWYARRVLCGSTGSFSSGGHVYLNSTDTTTYPFGTTDNPVTWYLSYCNLYDLTKAQYDGLRTRYADNADNAAYAEKALKDNKGQQIDTTYLQSVTVDVANHKLSTLNGFGSETNQSLDFVKLAGDTMTGSLYISAANTGERFVEAGNSNGKVRLYASTNRGLYDATKSNWIIYRAQAGTTTYIVNNGYTWTYTSDGKFDAPGDLGESANLIGTASRAVGDQFGHTIVDYINDISISGRTITIKTGGGAETTLTTQDTNTDTQVNVTLGTTTKAYLLGTTTTPTATAQGVTAIADTGVYLDTTAGTLTATTFNGNLAWSYLTSVPQIVEGALATNTAASGIVIQLYNLAGGAIAEANTAVNGKITIPAANGNGTNDVAGLVTTAAQTWAGEKTFKGNIVMDAEQRIQSRIKRKKAGGGGWEYRGFQFIGNDNVDFAHIGVHGSNDTLTCMYIGSAAYNADTNLKIYPNGDVTAKTFKGNLAWSYLTSVPQIVEGAVGSTISTGYQIQLYDLAGGAISANTSTPAKNGLIIIPLASTTSMGLVSTDTQSFVGDKTFTSNVYINTQTGSKKFYISRTGSTGESTAMWQDDTYMYFDVTNDGTTANIKWTLHATDTEANNGAGDQTSYITFSGANNKSTITADNFVGKLAWSNLTDVPQAVEGAVGTKATDKYTIQLYDLAGGAIATNTTAPAKNGVIVIPAASTSDAGLVTTGAQTFAGRKTFNDGITAKSDNDLISHSNEFNFAPALSANMDIHINHRTAGTNTNDAKITKYHFKDGNGQYTVIKASSFEGTVEWSNISSKPQAVEGAVGTKATDKYTIQLYDLAGGAIAANTTTPAKNGVIVIPAASINDAGLVTTGTQTFTGAKTFNTSISTPTLTVTGTGGFNYSGIQNGTTNAARVVWFADASYKGKPVYHTDFTYNPATGELKAGKFTSSGTMSGTALTLSLGNDSLYSTEDATLKVTGGASISDRLSARMVRIDNGVTDTAKGFNLIYNSTEECLEFRFGN